MKKFKNIKKMIKKKKFQSKTYKMWLRASKIIPEGNLMISKNPTLFNEKKWPSHFIRSKGCFIWDLDNKKYTDCSLMGVGTNILGYSNSKVNLKVSKAINNGNISSLNSFEEVTLAEKLLSFNNWAGKVLFARTGADANAISVRLARLYSGKDKIAICGYHGWHDWYLSSNLKNKNNLNKNLMIDLPISGVPKNLSGSSSPFLFNDKKSFMNAIKGRNIACVIMEVFRNIIKGRNIACVIMEVFRNIEPEKSFLKLVRKKSKKNRDF